MKKNEAPPNYQEDMGDAMTDLREGNIKQDTFLKRVAKALGLIEDTHKTTTPKSRRSTLNALYQDGSKGTHSRPKKRPDDPTPDDF